MEKRDQPPAVDRRSFLRRFAGMGGAWISGGEPAGGDGESAQPPAASAPARDGAAPDAPALGVPGVQLYTLRSAMQRDVAATLEEVAEIGYREVEFAGYFDWTPEQIRMLLERLGLAAPSAHVPLEALRQDLDRAMGAALTIGHRYLVVPWLDEEERTLAGYQRLAADLNRFGAACRERGLRCAYHNHDFEFLRLPGGRAGFDVLLAETDPALVDLELDLYWTIKAGRDPVDLLASQPGRFPLCHVKDMADRAGEPRMVPVGEGEIDFAAIFRHARQAGLKHFLVEHDDPSDPLASIRTSFRNLQPLLG